MSSPRVHSHSRPGLNPVFDGPRSQVLGATDVVDDFAAILRAPHALRRVLDAPDMAFAARCRASVSGR